ncbi:MAG TPA: MjaI family restriction endonuclease [Candidatus Handelsmanbacteria bacterium]|nr:MjaI family restriction endonuclease [Candidatus Handelsmanbacteria bacterium]
MLGPPCGLPTGGRSDEEQPLFARTGRLPRDRLPPSGCNPRVYTMLELLREALPSIDKGMVRDWVEDLVIVKRVIVRGCGLEVVCSMW